MQSIYRHLLFRIIFQLFLLLMSIVSLGLEKKKVDEFCTFKFMFIYTFGSTLISFFVKDNARTSDVLVYILIFNVERNCVENI